MTIVVTILVDGEELDTTEVHGYRGAGHLIRRFLEDLGLVFRGSFRRYTLPEGEVVTFVIIAKEDTQ